MKLLIVILALSLMGCEKEGSIQWDVKDHEDRITKLEKEQKKIKSTRDCRKYIEPKLDWDGWNVCNTKRMEELVTEMHFKDED